MYEKTMDFFRQFDPQVEDSIDKRSGSISHSSWLREFRYQHLTLHWTSSI